MHVDRQQCSEGSPHAVSFAQGHVEHLPPTQHCPARQSPLLKQQLTHARVRRSQQRPDPQCSLAQHSALAVQRSLQHFSPAAHCESLEQHDSHRPATQQLPAPHSPSSQHCAFVQRPSQHLPPGGQFAEVVHRATVVHTTHARLRQHSPARQSPLEPHPRVQRAPRHTSSGSQSAFSQQSP